jgi:hypothetical protein
MKKAYEIAFGLFASLAWLWLGFSVLAFVVSTIFGAIRGTSETIENSWQLWAPNVCHGLFLVVIADVAGRVRNAYPDDAGASPINTDAASTKRI